MARDEKDYMTNPSLIQRVTDYITQGGRPEYQEATEHPKTLSVYNEPYAKQNGAALGTFEYYVDDNGRLTKGVADMGISDPFTKINSQIDMNVSLQAPKVKIDGNRVVVQAPKEILSSPLVSQIKEELRSLKGSDLKSAEVQNAIKALNEEISTGLKDSLLNSATGWTRDQYNDYQYARQSVAGTNPMRSSNKIKGYDKDGNIIMKTPQEWVDYYRQFYNTDERGKAYEKSFYSSDPYERTMALVMGQGNKVPVYGFDTAERMGEGWKAFVNQMGKFPEGTLRLLAEDNDARRLEGIVNNKRIPIESMRKFNVNTEDEFNAKKESIKGKSWDELSDDDKAFIAILGVSREGELEREADTTEAMKDYRGSRTNTFAWDTNRQDYERAERKAARQISTEDLNNATSDDKEKSRDAINEILSDNSFEKYRTARNNYDTWQGYQDWTQEGEKELASTADWSGSEQWWGNLGGTIARYLWENAVVQGATGGISAKSLADPRLIRGAKAGGFAMNAVSDKIGAHIVGKLAQNGIAPTSRLGRNAMQFTANLIGTIPEDILQTSVDNVLTYNIKDNTALLDPQQMSENFRNNLIFMAGFNAIRAGLSAVNRARLAKQIAKAADLDEELVIGKFADADDVARAASKGQEIKVDGEKVSTVDVDGNETVLKNTTPEEANIVQQTIRPQEESREVFYHGVGDGSETGDTHGSGLYLTNDEGRARYYSKTDAPVEKYNIDNLNIFDLSNKLPDDIIGYLKKSAVEDAGINEMLLPLSTKTEVFSLDEVSDAKKTMDARVEEWKEHNGDERTRPSLSRGNNGNFVITSVDYTLDGLSRVTGEQLFRRLPSPIAQQIFTANGYNGVKYRAIGGDMEAVIYNGEATKINGGDTSGTGAQPEMVKTGEAIEPVKKKTRKEWKENPTYDQDYSLRRAEDVMEGRATLDDYLEEQKERMWEALKNSNQGTETFYHRDETGQIDGRNTVSYNGTLYRQLYEEYGGRPTKAEFGEAFDDVVKNGENSKYYEGFKEFDAEGDYSRGYNAGNEEVDTILALKEDVESAPAKATENAPEPEPGTGTARTEVEEPRVETKTTGVETAGGETLGEAPDIRVRNVDDGLKMRISPTPPNVRALHTQTLGAAMRDFSQIHLPEFQRRFPGVEVSDFDWVFHNTRNGLEPNQIVGMIDPETGREVTDQMIEAMQWFGDQPFMKDLRKASREALGLEGDFNMLGYLPHSTYDPSNLSFDEALTGQLWRQYTGASMIGENGQYKGFGGDFNSRYRTFASNMLWDARGKDVAAAKLMEEAEMDGKTITPEQAVRAVEGQQDIQRKVSDSATTKELEAALSSDTDVDKIDFKKIDEATKKQAQNSGLGKAIHDNYSEVYYGANSATVAKQSGATRQAFDTLGNTMRNTQIIDSRGRRMSLYDWGGADFVYAERNAIELVNRYMRDGGDLRDMLIEFVENHSHRTTEYAEAVADRWMGKLGDTPGRLTKAAAIRSLSGSMKWEAMGRIRKFLTMAKYDEFNSATKKTIDSFLFGHMQMDTIKTSQKIGKKLSSALNAMTSMRYRALFYGNVKNALLQTSELNRLFTTFKWGDVATMAKRMTTDANFKARVDDIYDAVAPQQSSFRSALYDDYAEVAGGMKTTQEGVSLKDGGKRMVEAVDNIGLAPIEAAEAFKNRMMVAALVQEADSLGLAGDDALRHIRGRFERVALAMDELGRIGMASNPIARTALFLQNFQIRELGMHIYNLSDELFAKNTKLPKRLLNASKYLSKVLGTKLATTLILARLGYSASQTLGYDPFGVLENYTGMGEEDMGGFDYFMRSPLFAGGMTSLLADMYFMARKAYEESSPKTISEEAEEEISGDNRDFFERTFSPLSRMAGLSFDDLMGLGQNFVPGNVFLNRINQMNEMMDTGWATSASGNKMYTAPSDALNTILGYLFGRSATQNAQQYNQTYGDNLLQTLGRMRPGRSFGEFDPIDSKNYSDWFKGDGNDRQQFEKGRRHFQQQRDRILDEYEDAMRKSRASNDDIAEAKNNMNQRLESLYEQLDRFVNAYERKNGTIDSAMTNQIVNLLNTGRMSIDDNSDDLTEWRNEQKQKALERYSQIGFSPVGTYTGPSEKDPEKEVKYQGSPQWRTASGGHYTLQSELAAVLDAGDAMLEDFRKELKGLYSTAVQTNNYTEFNKAQEEYMKAFDNVVGPIIATYGVGAINSKEVKAQLEDMLSTSSNSGKNIGNLIPYKQYATDKYGRVRNMPNESVNVIKWAQQRYSDDIYKQPTVRSYTAAGDDIMEIRRLISQGKPDRARARALQLKVRVDNQKRTISQNDYSWLLDFLNNTGE